MRFTVDRLDHLVLNVRDVEITAAWYQRVLGMEREDFGAERRTALKFGGQKINVRPAETEQDQWFTGRAIAPGSDDFASSPRSGPIRSSPICGAAASQSSAGRSRPGRPRPDAVGVLPRPGRQPDRGRLLPRGLTATNLSAFDFDLPPALIAQSPARPRDAARLLRSGRRASPIGSYATCRTYCAPEISWLPTTPG